MIDSIYRLGRIDYSQDTMPIKPKRIKKIVTNTREKAPEPTGINLLEMGIEQQLFFAVSPKLSEKVTAATLAVMVDGEQTVKANDRLRMRTLEDMVIQGIHLPRNTILFGVVKFRPNRVVLEVSSILNQPIQLIAHDKADGLEGIYIKNSFRGDIANQVLGDVVQDINIPGVPQVGGIKRVFQRSNRNVKVTVNNNYKLILKPKK